MEQKSSPVNTRRRYDSSGRRERARQVRDQITDIAAELFLSGGYAATTVAAIAAAAHVSVETIYKGFGGKPGLVRAIIEKGLAGEGPVPAERQSDQIREAEPDPRRILTAWGAFTAELGPRVVPVFLLARDAAASDPEIAALLEEISAARLKRMTVNARGLLKAGHLRPGITAEQAADILWSYIARPNCTNCLSSATDGPRGATASSSRRPDRRPAPRPGHLKVTHLSAGLEADELANPSGGALLALQIPSHDRMIIGQRALSRPLAWEEHGRGTCGLRRMRLPGVKGKEGPGC